MSDFLNELNDAQRAAVVNFQGPTMIVAGPGSGKTRVLTYRIAHMLRNGVDSFNILSLTFTNKSSKEMRHRIEKICGNEAKNLYMGTFHSVFARILRFKAEKLGYTSNFTIYDTDDAKSVLKKIILDFGLNDKLYKPNQMYNRISNAKNNLLTPKGYEKNEDLLKEDREAGRPQFIEIYKAYVKKCFENGAMDFDDLLLKTYELLVRFPEELYDLQTRFKYILIDEFQDTNLAQYHIVKKIADMNQNICVVGDDAQSIYAFRGATIQNIINFNRDYPDVRTFKLEQNYRSTKHIVEAANKIISKNADQIKKDIWTDNGEGEKIKVIKTISESEEAKMVANTIFANKNRYQMYNKDFAILYRTNSQSRAFEEQLRKLNIPYIIYGGTSFYQRKEIKDLVSYLKLAVNPYEEESMRRIINYPARAIGETTLQRASMYGKENNMKLWDVLQQIHLVVDLQARAKTAISEFVLMMQYFIMMQKEKNAYDLAFLIAKDTKLTLELYNDKSVEGVSRYENLQELLNGIKEFTEEDVVEDDEEASIDRSLGAYLQNITLLTDQDKTDENADNVKMMTIHASKGLEFKDVFVVGMEEGLFPSSMSMYDRDGLEEERRLFYVAVTRAEQRVSISFAMSRYKFGQLQYGEQSRFIDDIPRESIEMIGFDKAPINPLDIDFEDDLRPTSFKSFGPSKLQKTVAASVRKPSKENVENFVADDFNKLQAGMNVRHMLFGQGHIKAIEGSGDKKIAVIQFESEGEKKIMLKFAKLKIEE